MCSGILDGYRLLERPLFEDHTVTCHQPHPDSCHLRVRSGCTQGSDAPGQWQPGRYTLCPASLFLQGCFAHAFLPRVHSGLVFGDLKIVTLRKPGSYHVTIGSELTEGALCPPRGSPIPGQALGGQFGETFSPHHPLLPAINFSCVDITGHAVPVSSTT